MHVTISDHLDSIANHIVKLCQWILYPVSGGLVLSDWLAILDNHAGAIGATIAILTYFTNLIFQCLNRKALLKAAIRSLGDD
jgi:hypothetical protein